MELTFLGVNSALTMGEKSYSSNMLIISKTGKKLLIDCGFDIKHSLYEKNLTYSDIDAIYISHLHADHVGGLEWLAFAKFFIDKQKADLFISAKLKEKLWNNILSGGMSSLEKEEARLESFFNVQTINNDNFIWDGYTFHLISVKHTLHNKKWLPSFGLLIKGDKKLFFITTDTRFMPKSLLPIYNTAEIIFHDCETSSLASYQHARYSDLLSLDKCIRKKIWLYDYAVGKLPNACKDGFLGFVTLGQSFSL